MRRAAWIASSIAAGLLLGELYCRVRGLPFPKFARRVMAETPPIFKADAELGWTLKPGRYQLFDGKQVNILGGGRRATGSPEEAKPDVLVFGCSYTMGWGLSDSEGYVSRLHQLHPELVFANYGTPGYGAYQDLLLLQRLLRTSSPAPRTVLYGLVAHHEVRNHGDPAWSMMVASMPIPGSVAEVPWASVGPAGALEGHGLLHVPAWPLDSRSELVNLAKMDWLRFRARDHVGEGRAVTQEAILEMQRESEGAGARFAVVLLDIFGEAKEKYISFFQSRHIEFIDCTDPAYQVPAMRLSDHIHPNAQVHAQYAACISRHL